jgi:hypothetical protein
MISKKYYENLKFFLFSVYPHEKAVLETNPAPLLSYFLA